MPEGSRLFRTIPLVSQGHSPTRSKPYKWNGKVYPCPDDTHWRVSYDGLDRLAEKNRLFGETSLLWKQYATEVPGRKLHNVWHRSMSPSDKRYIVQTADPVLERCFLMSTSPGDLVLDFTCGSGTTPFIAEKWGRRWIAMDVSQVAIATARMRLITALFDYHAISGSKTGQKAEEQLRTNPDLKSIRKIEGDDSPQDPADGFVYRRVPYVSAKILAYDLEDKTPPIELVDQPVKVKGVTRVCSPFTVESDSPYRHMEPEEAASEDSVVRERSADYFVSHQNARAEVMEKTGIRLINGSHLEVDQLKSCLAYPLTHVATYRERDGGDESKQMAIAFAPDDATVSVGFMRAAGKKAREQLGREVDLLAVCGFAFDPATSEMKNHIDLPLARVQMNRQFQIEEVRIEKSDDNAFVMLGEPDIELEIDGEQCQVEVKGFSTFDPTTGNAKFGGAKDIYAWMLDTDYDGRSFFARRMHFPGQHKDKHIEKIKRELSNMLDAASYQAMLSHKSTPFPKPAGGQIAVKIITRTGDEMIRTKLID